jgi:uncharacterized membrane protein
VTVNRWAVLVHVLSAFGFVGGLAGRDVTLGKARRTREVGVVAELAELAGRFDRLMVVPGSIAVLVLGLLTVWVQGRPLTGSGNWWLLTSLVLYLSLMPLIPLVFLPRGRIFELALTDAVERGEVTPALTSALEDRAVRATRVYEWFMVTAVIVLMVTKPF